MSRFWSILFLLVPVLGIGAFYCAATGRAPLEGAWLPENYAKSGETIDHLFNLIHWICAFIFVGTGLTIGWFLWRFTEPSTGNSDSSIIKARYVHGNWKLETVWSVVPCMILLFIAFYQMKAWKNTKMDRPTIEVDGKTIPKPPLALVKAKQFGWEFHYAGPDNEINTRDDLYIENLLVVPDDETVVLQLESIDVIHSFFVPKLRLKQDVVPGMTQFVWFNPTGRAEIGLLCAELCGWGHSQMKGTVRIVSRQEFNRFISELQDQNNPPESTEQ